MPLPPTSPIRHAPHLQRSADRGATWADVGAAPKGNLNAIAAAPGGSGVVWAVGDAVSTKSTLMKSTDTGLTGIDAAALTRRMLHAWPIHPSHVQLAIDWSSPRRRSSKLGSLPCAAIAGSTWTQVITPLTAQPTLYGVSFKEGDPNTTYFAGGSST